MPKKKSLRKPVTVNPIRQPAGTPAQRLAKSTTPKDEETHQGQAESNLASQKNDSEEVPNLSAAASQNAETQKADESSSGTDPSEDFDMSGFAPNAHGDDNDDDDLSDGHDEMAGEEYGRYEDEDTKRRARQAERSIKKRGKEKVPSWVIRTKEISDYTNMMRAFWVSEEREIDKKQKDRIIQTLGDLHKDKKVKNEDAWLPNFHTIEAVKASLMAQVDDCRRLDVSSPEYVKEFAALSDNIGIQRQLSEQAQEIESWMVPEEFASLHSLEMPGKHKPQKDDADQPTEKSVHFGQNSVRSMGSNKSNRSVYTNASRKSFKEIIANCGSSSVRSIPDTEAILWKIANSRNWVIAEQHSKGVSRFRLQLAAQTKIPDPENFFVRKNMMTTAENRRIPSSGACDLTEDDVIEVDAIAWKNTNRADDDLLFAIQPDVEGHFEETLCRTQWKNGSTTWEIRTGIRRLFGKDRADNMIYTVAWQQEGAFAEANDLGPVKSAIEPDDDANSDGMSSRRSFVSHSGSYVGNRKPLRGKNSSGGQNPKVRTSKRHQSAPSSSENGSVSSFSTVSDGSHVSRESVSRKEWESANTRLRTDMMEIMTQMMNKLKAIEKSGKRAKES